MRKVMRWLFRTIPWLCTAVVLVLSLAGFVPEPNWQIDNVAQLRIPLLIAVTVLLLVSLPLRSRRLTSILLLLTIFDAIPVAALYLPGSMAQAAPSNPTVKVIASNVWGARNLSQSAFEEMIRAEQPDVFILIEQTPQWLKALKRDLPEYRTEFDEKLVGGTAIFSKIPIRQIMMDPLPHHRRFGVRGVLSVNGQDVLLIGSHPPAPSRTWGWNHRNTELLRLAEDVERETPEHPVVIAGDLNTTPWSFYFRRLLSCGLHDSEQGLGPQSSWSQRMALPMVPIDHALYTDGVVVLNRRLGPDIGSDHLPVIFEIARTR
jgi:endonuclease/exonuclease/phosphatase (EEP) superfamily protein YafD